MIWGLTDSHWFAASNSVGGSAGSIGGADEVPYRGVHYECHLEEDEYLYSSVCWAPHHKYELVFCLFAWQTMGSRNLIFCCYDVCSDQTLTLLCGGPGVVDVYTLNSLSTLLLPMFLPSLPLLF